MGRKERGVSGAVGCRAGWSRTWDRIRGTASGKTKRAGGKVFIENVTRIKVNVDTC